MWIKYFKQAMQCKKHCITQLQAQCAWSTSTIQYETRCIAQCTTSTYQAQQRARMKSCAKRDPKGNSKSASEPENLLPKVPKSHQDGPQKCQGNQKLRPGGSSWPQDAPKRLQMEAKRRPRPPYWRPRGAKLDPRGAQERPCRGQKVPKSLPRAPKI